MKKIFAVIALFFAFVSTSALAKNDYSCDKKFIFFPGGPEGGPTFIHYDHFLGLQRNC